VRADLPVQVAGCSVWIFAHLAGSGFLIFSWMGYGKED